MLDPPVDLAAEDVASALLDYWSIEADVAYAPLGYGSYNWTASVADIPRWFVKANPSGHGSDFYRATYRTARSVHDAGLTLVSAAVPDRDQELRRRIPPAWDLSVFPFIEGRNPDFQGAERPLIAEAVGRLRALAPVTTEALRWTPGWRQPELRLLLADELDGP